MGSVRVSSRYFYGAWSIGELAYLDDRLVSVETMEWCSKVSPVVVWTLHDFKFLIYLEKSGLTSARSFPWLVPVAPHSGRTIGHPGNGMGP